VEREPAARDRAPWRPRKAGFVPLGPGLFSQSPVEPKVDPRDISLKGTASDLQQPSPQVEPFRELCYKLCFGVGVPRKCLQHATLQLRIVGDPREQPLPELGVLLNFPKEPSRRKHALEASEFFRRFLSALAALISKHARTPARFVQPHAPILPAACCPDDLLAVSGLSPRGHR
jgi:hypothetical protein